MPKVTWRNKPEPKNYETETYQIKFFFRACMAKKKWNYEDLAVHLMVKLQAVRYQMTKDDNSWNIRDIRHYCDALGVMAEDALAVLCDKKSPAL